MPFDDATLFKMAQKLRRDSILSTTEAGSGHPTTCMSAADLVSVLFFDEMRFDPRDPSGRDADLFVLSKGHAAPILWAALKEAGTVAVLLPGTPLGLGLRDYAPARALIEAGVPVALATDCNPGTCPSENLALMISLACSQMKMAPAEALVAATVNSAHALDRGDRLGSLEPGKLADVVVWDAPNHRHLAYHFGVNLACEVYVGGLLAWQAQPGGIATA